MSHRNSCRRLAGYHDSTPLGRWSVPDRWLGHGLAMAGVAILPWIVHLRSSVPLIKTVPNWSTAWIGLDFMEAASLAATGVLMARGDERHRLGAAATAVLLAADAWFDLATSSPGSERAAAVAMAVGAEIPLASLCTHIAARRDSRVSRPADQGAAL